MLRLLWFQLHVITDGRPMAEKRMARKNNYRTQLAMSVHFLCADLWAHRCLSVFLWISSDTYYRSMIIASIVLFPSSYFIQSNNELVQLLTNPSLHDAFQRSYSTYEELYRVHGHCQFNCKKKLELTIFVLFLLVTHICICTLQFARLFNIDYFIGFSQKLYEEWLKTC